MSLPSSVSAREGWPGWMVGVLEQETKPMAKKSGEIAAPVPETEQVAQEIVSETEKTTEAAAPEVAQLAAVVSDATTHDVPATDVATSDVPTSDVATSDVPTSDVATGETTRGAVAPQVGFLRTERDFKAADIKTGVTNVVKTVEDIFAFGQGNVEAFVKSSQIWTAGVQDLSKAVAATAQAQLDHTFATVKALAAIKSVKEVVELQTNLARASVEKAVAETGKLTDASVKLAEQAWAPINERVTLAVEKFGRAA
jgi:phasin family protein